MPAEMLRIVRGHRWRWGDTAVVSSVRVVDGARAVVLVGLLLASGCTGSRTPHVLGNRAPAATQKTVKEPTSAKELGMSRDASGRVYDAALGGVTGFSTRRYGRLHIPGGHLRIMDGSALGVFPGDDEQAVKVELGPVDVVDVDIVWAKHTYKGKPGESSVGVLVKVPGADAVARWGRFEDAYGTDGGQGGILSQAVIDRASSLGFKRWKAPDLDFEAELSAFDFDGVPGLDSLIFDNGYGDGGFPMSRGFDAKGGLVAVMVWSPTYPWRLAVPYGKPPPDVTQRENEIQACIDGTRPIVVYGKNKTCT